MRVLIISSCTGQKSKESSRALTCHDFERGSGHVRARENELDGLLTPAEDLYSGQQHIRLMRGVERIDGALDIDLHIVSAGYGLITGGDMIAPYECTFAGRGKAEIKAWAQRLGLPSDFRRLVAAPYDVALLLLGNDYLVACELEGDIRLGGPTITLCSRSAARVLSTVDGVIPVPLGNPEARRFSCGLVGLKGEIASRLLQALASRTISPETLARPGVDLLSFLDPAEASSGAHCKQSCGDHIAIR